MQICQPPGSLWMADCVELEFNGQQHAATVPDDRKHVPGENLDPLVLGFGLAELVVPSAASRGAGFPQITRRTHPLYRENWHRKRRASCPRQPRCPQGEPFQIHRGQRCDAQLPSDRDVWKLPGPAVRFSSRSFGCAGGWIVSRSFSTLLFRHNFASDGRFTESVTNIHPRMFSAIPFTQESRHEGETVSTIQSD